MKPVYSTVRLRPTQRQLCLALKLLEALGADTTNLTYSYSCQMLFDSIIQTHLDLGTIEDITDEAAAAMLEERNKKASVDLGESLSLKGLNTLAEIESDQDPSSPISPGRLNVEDAIDEAQRRVANEGLDDIFPTLTPKEKDEGLDN